VLEHRAECDAGGRQSALQLRLELQRSQGVAERAPHQELHRQIVHASHSAFGRDPVLRLGGGPALREQLARGGRRGTQGGGYRRAQRPALSQLAPQRGRERRVLVRRQRRDGLRGREGEVHAVILVPWLSGGR
jgi:hypothetical protein